MPRTPRGVEQLVDSQRRLKYIRELRHNREDYEEDLKEGFSDDWKKKFKEEWDKTTSKLKEGK